MSDTGLLSTPSGRQQRLKKPTIKALEYREVEDQLKSLELAESVPDIFEDSSSSQSLIELTESSSESSKSETEEDDGSDDAKVQEIPKLPSKIYSKVNADKTQKKTKTQLYMIKAEDYFYQHSLKKGHTSNHSLNELKKPRLSQEELHKLLFDLTTTNHRECFKKICKYNKSFFSKWLCLLHEGFNILVYGLGSKRDLLHDFQKECLCDMPLLVINGFFPSLTMKEIIEAIMTDILGLDNVPANIFEASNVIAQEIQHYPNLHLYIIVHNIEGETLRSNLKHQDLLANLAAIDNIHLIASIDHINAPLIWDQNKLSKFNFTWWDVTTFLSYKQETSFETSMMVTKSGSLALSSLRNVFLSLTSNSRDIYLIIANYQLQNMNKTYQGMLFKDLYWACREAFLVSSDMALRAQLREFEDHKMVKPHRSVDGAERVKIQISSNVLQQFLNEQ